MPGVIELRMEHQSRYHVSKETIQQEEHLILAAQKDVSQFEPLYNRYYSQILSFVYHRVETREIAYDITSQVFYNALTSIKKYKTTGVPFSAWLYRIALNELNRMFRSEKVRRCVGIDSNSIREISEETGASDQAESDRKLREAIKKLTPDEITLVELRYFEKRAFKEIADLFETTESTVKQRMYRILEKLKGSLKDI